MYNRNLGNEGALDLSSRRDSVETPRKTPSPYTTNSSYGEPSPNGSHEFTGHNSSNDQNKFASRSSLQHYLAPPNFNSAGTPPASAIYQAYPYHSANQTAFPYDTKCEMISPRGSAIPTEERLRKVETQMSPFMLNAVAYQHQIAQAQLAAQVQQESPAASPTAASPIEISLPSTSSTPVNYPLVMGRDGKLARPFKAYPRDPLSISAGFTTSEKIDAHSAGEYSAFRKRILDDICEANGGTPTLSNPKMRRTAKSTRNELSAAAPNAAHLNASNSTVARINQQNGQPQVGEESEMDVQSENANDVASMDLDGSVKDSAYFERRKKNNAAAKKSRDRRRIKEDEIAIRAAFLERENLELKVKLSAAYQHLEMLGVLQHPPPVLVAKS